MGSESGEGELSSVAQAALRAVSDAAIVTRAVQRQQQRGKIDKADGSPVTIADFAAQAAIIRSLTRAAGGVGGEEEPEGAGGGRGAMPLRFVAEESSAYLKRAEHEKERRAALEALRLVWPEASEDEFLSALDYGAAGLEGEPGGHDWPEAFWTIDPIDGTKGFIRGHQYSVCLALVVRGVPTVGVLGCPNLSADLERPFDDPDPHGITVVAGGGDAGVWAVPTDEPGTRLRRLEVAPRSGASGEEGAIRFCESWESSHTDQSATRRVMRVLADAGHAIGPAARIDSQCKYVVAARGQADVFLRRPRDSHRRDWIWDHAPGWLIATRAGLCVTDAHGREVRFGLGRTLAANHGVLAARGTTHALVRRALAQLDGPGER